MSFVSSSACAENNFDLIHCDFWTSPIVMFLPANIIVSFLKIVSFCVDFSFAAQI
jgi:hypothetical protein